MLEIVLIAIAVIIVALVVVVALQPAAFRVERSIAIAAPPAAVFAQVNDYRNWRPWSPYEKLDPDMKRSYEGPSAGTGAIYSWAGNKNAGEGRATIIESRPGERIRIKLEFKKPFEATNTAEFTFKPEGDRTLVTWSLAGERNFFFKAVHLFMNVDKMVGGQFDEGLAALKAVAEGVR
ncbi:MAG TPA: SRPBCC family protein [Dongiaceae bacterium]|jgi:hypothetical protein